MYNRRRHPKGGTRTLTLDELKAERQAKIDRGGFGKSIDEYDGSLGRPYQKHQVFEGSGIR